MKKEYPRLKNLQLVHPCPINLAGLDPAEKENFCKSCNKEVYNLSVLSSDEAETLLEEKGREACVMFVRKNDGRIVTDNCPTFLRPLRRSARVAISLVSLISIWLLVQGKAMAQGLVGAAQDVRYGCTSNPVIPLDEKGLWISGLSFLVAWCTWLEMIANARTSGQGNTVSNSIYFLIAMLVVILAPAVLADNNAPVHGINAAVKMALIAAGPILALFIWLYKNTRQHPNKIGLESIALAIAIVLAFGTMSTLQPFRPDDVPVRIVLETSFTFAFVGIASALDALICRRSPQTWSSILGLLITPPLIAYTWGTAIRDPGWLVPSVVALSCLAVLLRHRIFATVAVALYAFPFMPILLGLLFSGYGANGQLRDFGYDTARDLVRFSSAMALAFAFTVIWWHKIKQIKLSPQTIIMLMSIPVLVYLIGTFMINNFGGLGGGGI